MSIFVISLRTSDIYKWTRRTYLPEVNRTISQIKLSKLKSETEQNRVSPPLLISLDRNEVIRINE